MVENVQETLGDTTHLSNLCPRQTNKMFYHAIMFIDRNALKLKNGKKCFTSKVEWNIDINGKGNIEYNFK